MRKRNIFRFDLRYHKLNILLQIAVQHCNAGAESAVADQVGFRLRLTHPVDIRQTDRADDEFYPRVPA